jgi:hypothetical protein
MSNKKTTKKYLMLFTLHTFVVYPKNCYFLLLQIILKFMLKLYLNGKTCRGFLQLESEDRSVAFKRQWRRNSNKKTIAVSYDVNFWNGLWPVTPFKAATQTVRNNNRA